MIQKIKDSFKNTGIRNYEIVFDHPWYCVYIDRLDVEEMEKISKWIRYTFSKEGTYSHLLPKMGSRNGRMVIVISKEQIEKTF